MNFLENCKIEFVPESIERKIISDEEYFTQYPDYISNSQLKLINPAEGGSIDKFFNKEPSEFDGSLEFGSAIHELVLQPDNFELIDYQFKPPAKLGKFIESVVEFRKQKYSIEDSIKLASKKSNYYVDKLSPKLLRTAMTKGLKYYYDLYFERIESEKSPIILSPKSYSDVYQCMQIYNKSNLKRFIERQNITETKKNFNEEAIFVDIKVTFNDGESEIIKFKGKLDNYSVDDDEDIIILNDLKTTSKKVDSFMGYKYYDFENSKYGGYVGSFQKYHYYRQMAVYMLLLQQLYKDKSYKYFANILTIESFGPDFNNKIYPISNAYIQKGLTEFKNLICMVAFHKHYNK